MSVITISRQYGSGGSMIATQICDRLGYHLLDKQLIMQAAAEVGLSEQAFVDLSEQEYKVKGLRDRLAQMLWGQTDPSKPQPLKMSWGGLDAQLDKDWFIELVNSTIRNAYTQGKVVILGRGGQIVLKDKPDVLHVRIEAPLELRVKRVQQAEGIIEREARQRIDEHDQISARYLQEAFKAEWDNPLLYHLVINTAKWDLGQVTAVIVAAATQLQAVPVG